MATRSADVGGSSALVVNELFGIALGKTATKTAAYTTAGEGVIFVDPSGGAFQITLSDEDNIAGRVIILVNVGGTNTFTIDTETSTTELNGATSALTVGSAIGTMAICVCNDTDWYVSEIAAA